MRTIQLLIFCAVLLFVALAGCSQHGCLVEASLPPTADAVSGSAGHATEAPEIGTACAKISTVLDPEAPKREISLHECIALALENGRAGGTKIRVLSYDPAINHAAIELALSRFDARWFTGMGWSALDERAGNVLSSLPLGFAPAAVSTAAGGVAGGVGPGGAASIANLTDLNNVSGASFDTLLEKPLPTGGVAGITFKTDYTLVNQPPPAAGEVNPSYRPRIVLSAEQPLLRGAGVSVNEVPILIARVTFDQEREKFVAAVNQLLFSVEQAYWDLYFSYWNLHVQDSAMRQAHDAWQFARQLREKNLLSVQDLAALEWQYQTLRLARLRALGGTGQSVLEAERRLRFVVGLPPEDGHRLIPTDTPTTAPYVPDWHSALSAALYSRPELVQLRQEVKKIDLDIKRLKNQALPDLRAVGTYDWNGLGNRLDGAGPNGAFQSLTSGKFNDWTLGMTLDVPIGFRAAQSQLQRAKLQMRQREVQLRDMEEQATFALQQSYRDLLRIAEEVRIQAGIRKAATERYQALYELFRAGQEGPNFLLLAQQNWASAFALEQSTIFAYNIAIAKFHLERGTIQEFDHVSISDGPLPLCAEARASAHIKERQKALTLRQRPDDRSCPTAVTAPADGPPAIPTLHLEEALSPDGHRSGAGGHESLPEPQMLKAQPQTQAK